MRSWGEAQAALADLAQRQMFFIGGAPRSGTTWLQQMLDCHPDVCCRGEGLFWQQLATPLDTLLAQRRRAVAEKNEAQFRHTGGYKLPGAEHADMLLGTAVLLALQQQTGGEPFLAIGEKTPENVFLFPRLKALFPRAKFIGIARDPRDVLTSAWHFFHQPRLARADAAALLAFIRSALPSLVHGTRAMVALAEAHKLDAMLITYEALHAAPMPALARLFGFLGVSNDPAILRDCVTRTDFAAQAKQPAAAGPAFLRKGVVGDWRSTLTPEMNALVLAELGWMFPRFGWRV